MSAQSTGGRATPLERAMALLDELQAKVEELEQARREPIAVIGMGCRYPGGADNPELFWQNLRAGTDSVCEIPRSRWKLDDYYDANPDAPGKMITRHGGFLEGIDRFDAPFFRISPREAAGMDPQQRLLLEVAWEAMEDAGIPIPHPHPTGVFIGITNNDYLKIQSRMPDDTIDSWYASGSLMNVAAGRISYIFGLQGPSMAVDTACSSSLSAIHLACKSLRNRECNTALAGGVSLILSPELNIHLSRARMMATDGRCKTFDASADGYVRGEGCGIVILQRLADAVREGNRILAVIRGSAVNSGGSSSGLTVPNGLAQQEVIRMALDDAGVDPREVGYLEAHGTGTPLGDPIEFRALAAVLCPGRDPRKPLAVGSVKTNIGHTEAAAGVAGVIKVIQSMRHGEIPPHLHFRTLNPDIAMGGYPAYVPTQLVPWPGSGGRRIAGVSSFGFSGTNAHVVVEATPPVVSVASEADRPIHLLAISARNEAALAELAGRYADHLRRHPDVRLGDLCFSAHTGRSAMPYRLAAVAANGLELAGKLEDRAHSCRSGHVEPAGDSGPVFLFTGQGSQYAGMGRGLMESQPVFRRSMEECDRLLRPVLNESLLDAMAGDAIDQTAYTQPAIFALEYSLAELWRSWGVQPAAVMGHSLGEYVAACVAGVFSLEDGLRLVAERARLMQDLPADGEMRLFSGAPDRIADAVAGHRDRVSIAAVNGPEFTVVSGDAESVRAIAARLEAEGVGSRHLKVSHAFHSPLMEPMIEAFERRLEQVRFQSPRIRVVSNLSGDFAKGDDLSTARYWVRQLREPVQFLGDIERLRTAGYRTFVELGPHPTLTGMAQRCLPDGYGVWASSLRRGTEDCEEIFKSLGRLFVNGAAIDWRNFDRPWARRKTALPTYPFQRERHWLEERTSAPARPEHPILGTRLRTALEDTIFENRFSPTSPRLLDDHRIHGTMVAPASCYISMLVAATGTPSSARDLFFPRALVLQDDQTKTVQLILSPQGSFRLFSKRDQDAWVLHASGTFAKVEQPAVYSGEAIESIQQRCAEEIAGQDFYAEYRTLGYDLGPAFQWIDRIWRRDGEALGRMTYAHAQSRPGETPQPGLIDSCLQLLCHSLPGGGVGSFVKHGQVYIPLGIDRFVCARSQAAEMWCHVRLTGGDAVDNQVFRGEFRLFTADGETIAAAEGVRLIRAEKKALFPAPECWRLSWEEQAAGLPPQAARARWRVVGEDPAAGELSRLVEGDGEDEGVVCFARSCTEVLQLVQSAGRRAIWVVTRGAQQESPEQSAIWGLGRVAAAERPDIWRGLIDLAPQADATDAAHIASEILGGRNEDQVMFRSGKRYVARLAAVPKRRARRLEVRPDATYLITGGRGALGGRVAERLIQLGARSLVLVGRSRAIAEERPGVRIAQVCADVANRAEMEALFDSIPRLAGIVHCAGIVDDALLERETPEHLAKVCAPKVEGSWNLHMLSQRHPLDFFVMFSSFSSLMGLPGQAAYAAANAYMDGLAHHRRGLGLPALSINWGAWAAAGMAARSGRTFETIEPDAGLDVMEDLIASGETQMAVMPGLTTSWRNIHPRAAGAPLLERVLAAEARAAEPVQAFNQSAFRAASNGEREAMVEAAIAGATSRTLSIPPSKLDPCAPLSEYGLDSLIAFSLINRIKAEMGVTLPVQKFLGGASLEQLGRDALQEMLISSLSEQCAPVESNWETVEL